MVSMSEGYMIRRQSSRREGKGSANQSVGRGECNKTGEGGFTVSVVGDG